nr:vegetative cell wall protein gp1-like [Aegilops tauschii subsp. strangulata]
MPIAPDPDPASPALALTSASHRRPTATAFPDAPDPPAMEAPCARGLPSSRTVPPLDAWHRTTPPPPPASPALALTSASHRRPTATAFPDAPDPPAMEAPCARGLTSSRTAPPLDAWNRTTPPPRSLDPRRPELDAPPPSTDCLLLVTVAPDLAASSTTTSRCHPLLAHCEPRALLFPLCSGLPSPSSFTTVARVVPPRHARRVLFMKGRGANLGHDLHERKKALSTSIEALDLCADATGLSPEEWLSRYDLEDQLSVIYTDKEGYWRPHGSKKWVLKGDANTAYFQAIANGRRRRDISPLL